MSPHVEAHPPAYLSPSRLSCYERCPQLFHERYILKQDQQPSVERQFGVAVHKGIEAHFRGQDYEMAFLVDWRKSVLECRRAGLFVAPAFTQRGLELIDEVRQLGLRGEPERKLIYPVAGLKIPILGYADLWDGTTVWDFKTAGAKWGEARVQKELFQPALYAYGLYQELELPELPQFRFVVLPRIAGPVQILDGTKTEEQVYEILDLVQRIHDSIEREEFGCKGKSCQEHRDRAA